MMSGKGKPTPKKGISKFKECSKSSSSKGKVDSSDVSSKDTVLTYPLIKTSENERLLPRYSAVLSRSEEDGVGMDDLDSIQIELESLLSAVALRARALQEEILALSNAEERQDKRAKVSPLVPGKRVKSQEKTVKKFKETGGKVVAESYHSPTSNKIVKTKTMSPGAPAPNVAEGEVTDPLLEGAPKVVVPKNDTPNKFWAFVEPYCADITQEEVKLLESLLEENGNDSEYYEVPPLGKHYTLRWVEEDNLGEKSIKSEYASRKNERPNECVTTGPLTQRLFSALLEENFVPVDIMCKGDENRIPQLFKSFTANNSANFERRVRKELEEQGILDIEEMMRDEENDEILQELKRCQMELKRISTFNGQHLKRLIKLANEELERQELRKQLQEADNEVMKIHRKVLAAKRKKKVFTKKEQELCWKALKDRDSLLRLIDSL